jgi:hypothetical protein
MVIKVVPHDVIKPQLRVWRRSLGNTRSERDEVAKKLWAEFVQIIVEAEGPPAGALPDLTRTPTCYVCDFPGGWSAEIIVEPDRREGWFSTVRRVVVINLFVNLDPPG